MLIFVSLIFVALFGFIFTLTLNYAIYEWESKRVTDLTNQIKPSNSNLSSGGSFAKNFSSVDLGSSLNKNRALQVAGNIYDRAVVSITNKEYPGWINKLVDEFNLFRKNAWKSLSRLFRYLISLTKPVHKTSVEQKTGIDLGTKKESVAYTDTELNSKDFEDTAFNTSRIEESEEIQDVDYKIPQEKKEEELATISFAASRSQKSASEMTVFEKLESRILEKLKSSGFDHYDIWLELGSLYEKYDEKEKAVEVYAFVMKQGGGKEKDLARDKLIGLS